MLKMHTGTSKCEARAVEVKLRLPINACWCISYLPGQAFRNVVKRMLEAAGRGMWNADDSMLAKLRSMYNNVEDQLEGVR